MNVLLIGRFSSSCGNCGRQTLPEEKTHHTISGYDPSRPGCGVEWTHVSSNYFDPYGRLQERLKEMRPDLIFIDPMTGAVNV